MNPQEDKFGATELFLAASIVDDLEKVRIANNNRLEALKREAALTSQTADEIVTLEGLVEGLEELEKRAVQFLEREMKKHPLAGWVARTKGAGLKTSARLIVAVGDDPYWNARDDRPRSVSELWRYCGLDPVDGVARKKKRGQRAAWSHEAKKRAYLIAESMLKSGNRELYDKRRVQTEERLHVAPCMRCGPSGHPAQPGTKWSAGHQHADALRIVSKEILKQLWIEARGVHNG